MRAAAGDRVALEQLLAAIQPRVRRICGRMLLYPEDAEEAAQDALLLVATKIGSLRGPQPVHHLAARGGLQQRPRRPTAPCKRRSAEQTTDEMPIHADPRTTSVIAGSRLDLLEALEVVGADHPELVEPLVLRDVQELEYADIADLLEIPLGTVKSRIHAARRRSARSSRSPTDVTPGRASPLWGSC